MFFKLYTFAIYSPYRASSEYHLFPGLKKQLKSRHFSSDTEVIAAAETWLDEQPSDFFLSGLQKVEQDFSEVYECLNTKVSVKQ